MNEEQWFACSEPRPMLDFLGWKSSRRKLRLFALECCRRSDVILSDNVASATLMVAERHAEEKTTPEEVTEAFQALSLAVPGQVTAQWYRVLGILLDRMGTFSPAHLSVARMAAIRSAEDAASAGTSILVGNYYVAPAEQAAQCRILCDIIGNPFQPIAVDPRWQTPTVIGLAETIYQDRTFNHLPILADALEEAGCDKAYILRHCRQPGEHVRGCWVVDLITGRK